MRLATGWVLFGCVLVLSPACGDDDNATDIGQDAPVDTRRDATEVSRDIGRDAPRNTARDVPEDVPEDPLDGGPDDPGWVGLAGLPDYCAIERATHPERLWRSEWLSCGDGCVYLSDDPAFTRTIFADAGWHDGEMGVFVSLQVPVPASAGGRIVLIARTDGHVYAAWREPLSRTSEGIGCQVLPVVGDGYAVVPISVTNTALRVRDTRIMYATLDEIGVIETPVVVFDATTIPLGAVLQNASVSREVFAAELQPAGDLLLVRPDGSVDRQRPVGNSKEPTVVGEDVFFELWEDGKTRILHTRFGEEPNVLLDDPDVHFVGLTVTAGTLTWLRAPSDGRLSRAERIDLYTSSYATRAEDIAPRFVANYLPDHATGYDPNVVGGEGFFTAFRAPFFRLSDGAALQYPPVDGRLAGNIGFLWMAGGEVAISTLLTLDDGGTGTIARVSLDSLRSLE